MALRKSYSVACDKCWRSTGEFDTSQAARAAARRRGWQREARVSGSGERGKDYCPRCVEAGREAPPNDLPGGTS